MGVHAFVFVCAELLIGGGGSWELLLLRSSDRVEANIDVFTVVGWSFLNNSLTMQCVYLCSNGLNQRDKIWCDNTGEAAACLYGGRHPIPRSRVPASLKIFGTPTYA